MTERDAHEPVRFQLFDDVVAHAGTRRVEMGSARERCLLTALLLHNDRRVYRTDLVDWIWDEAPKNPSGELDRFMTNLRKRLAGTGLDAALVSRDGLCQLTVPAESVDLYRFRALVAEARGADATRAATLLAEALELSRGVPLAGLQNLRIDAVRQGLVKERYGAELAFVRAELLIGHHEERIADAVGLFTDHPDDATAAELAMRAFHLAGRQTDALEVYREHRDQLVEVGLLVSPPVAELYAEIIDPKGEKRQDDVSPPPRTGDDRGTAPVSATELAHARSTPDPPAEAREALASHHIVVLVGAPDDCRTTALRLLGDRSQSDDRIVIDVLKSWTHPAVSALPPPLDKRGYLLALNDITTDRANAAFAEDLLSHAGRLADRGSYLVVTTRPELWRDCWHAAGHLTVRLTRPPRPEEPDLEHLHLTDPDGRQTIFPLRDGTVPRGHVVLGRSTRIGPDPDIVLDSGTSSPVSREHALLTYEKTKDGDWWIEPTGKNLPQLLRRGESHAVELRERVAISNGDVVLIHVRAAEDGGWRGWRIEFNDPNSTMTSRGGQQ